MNKPDEATLQPWYYRKPLSESIKNIINAQNNAVDEQKYNRFNINRASEQSIAIIGGGIASAMLCYQLCIQNIKVSLYCKDSALAQNASGNTQGAIYPLVNSQHDAASQFSYQAYQYTLALFNDLKQKGIKIPFSQCGVLQLGFDAKSRVKNDQLSRSERVNSFFETLEPEQTNQYSGLNLNMPAIFYPDGGWINAAEMTHLLMKLAQDSGNLSLHYNSQVSHLTAGDAHWQLKLANESSQPQHPAVILACGHAITDFEQTKVLPLTAVRGQVSHIPSTGELPLLKSVLCYKGYLTPNNKRIGLEKNTPIIHHLGASHKHNDQTLIYRHEEQEQNKNNLSQCLSLVPSLINSVDVSKKQARVAVRCASRDHLPFVGQVPNYAETIKQYQIDSKGERSSKKLGSLPQKEAPAYEGLYMLTGLGSRGLCTAALSSKILVSHMLGQQQTVSQDILNLLNPNRMWIRKLLKGRPV